MALLHPRYSQHIAVARLHLLLSTFPISNGQKQRRHLLNYQLLKCNVQSLCIALPLLALQLEDTLVMMDETLLSKSSDSFHDASLESIALESTPTSMAQGSSVKDDLPAMTKCSIRHNFDFLFMSCFDNA